jgi:uncharacterized protein (TIGR00725 family)
MQIAVIGNSEATPEQYEMALEVGRLIAKAGHIAITGGRTGVMEAVARGVSLEGGISVGILPSADGSDANPYNTVNIPTGMGYTRNALNIHAADLVLVVGGSTGTLNEMTYAWMFGKPMYVLKGSQGYGEEFAGRSFDGKHSGEVEVIELSELSKLW